MSVVHESGNPRKTTLHLRAEAAQFHHQADLCNSAMEARQVPAGDPYQRQTQGLMRAPGARGGHRHIQGEFQNIQQLGAE